jgi:hypothetical protein
MSYDSRKARDLLAAEEDGRELQRAMRARHLEAREEQYRSAAQVYGRNYELQAHASLADLAAMSDDELWKVSVRRAEVQTAIAAAEYAADLRRRLDATIAATAPAVRLSALVREFLHQQGVHA